MNHLTEDIDVFEINGENYEFIDKITKNEHQFLYFIKEDQEDSKDILVLKEKNKSVISLTEEEHKLAMTLFFQKYKSFLKDC